MATSQLNKASSVLSTPNVLSSAVSTKKVFGKPHKFDVDLKKILQDSVHREEALRILYGMSDDPREQEPPIRNLPLRVLASYFGDPSVLDYGRHMVVADRVTCEAGEEVKTVSVYPLPYGANVVNSQSCKSSVTWITDMLPLSHLQAVLMAGLERAAERGITIKSSVIQPAQLEWEAVEAPAEATGWVDVDFACDYPDGDGDYIASTPTTDAMAPAYPRGEIVIFREGVEQQHGTVVLAVVTELCKPYDPDHPSNVVMTVIRRYSIDSSGQITLSPLAPGFKTFTEGLQGKSRCQIEIIGVATDYKASWARQKPANMYEVVCHGEMRDSIPAK